MPSRQEIADAIATIAVADGTQTLTASKARPTVMSPGCAWPRIGSVDWNAGAGYGLTWQVWIVLPSQEEAAAVWLEANAAALIQALKPVLFVDRIEPITIPADNTSALLGLLITARSE